jgi:hypothetical protein
MRSLEFLIELILPAAVGSTQQESSWGVEVQPECKADNLTAICESIV